MKDTEKMTQIPLNREKLFFNKSENNEYNILPNNFSLSKEKLEEITRIYNKYKKPFCIINPKCEVKVLENDKENFFMLQFKEHSFKQHSSIDLFSNETFQQILNASTDGITICDRNGYFVFVNHADRKMAGGYNPTGARARNIVSSGLLDRSASLLVIDKKEPVHIIQKYNNDKQVLVSSNPIFDSKGNIEYVVSITRDMTYLRKLEEKKTILKNKQREIEFELQKLKETKKELIIKNDYIANDPKSIKVVDRAIRVGQVDSTVFIQGETGVGKEGIVKIIHQNSPRKHKRLIPINCATLPEKLLESELFGYEPGAFTGANQKGKKGLFELADKGTIFLDEIGEMSLNLQAKLLRVLQESEFTRIGGEKPIHVDVRIITATNRNIYKLVKEGKFREDLYYRLNIVPIYIPPLRERKQDIIPLTHYFIKKLDDKYNLNKKFNSDVFSYFQSKNWPGNIRQLKNLVERVYLMINKKEITIDDIRFELDNEIEGTSHDSIYDPKDSDDIIQSSSSEPLKIQVENFEKKIIIESLKKFPSIRQTAKALRVDQSTLVRKMQRYGIEKQKSYR